MNAIGESAPRVELAHEPDFRLGGLLLQPSACRVSAADGEQRLEPRVMEVLVVLARAGGRTVTRDELIEACWEGRFVSDDAITRIIAKVRNLARSTDPPPFVLETVPKVGFRLTAPDVEAGPQSTGGPPWTSPVRRSRLPVIGAAMILLIAAAGVWLAWRLMGEGAGRIGAASEWVEVAGFKPLQDDPELERLAVQSNDALTRALAANGVDPAPGSGGPARLRMSGTVDRDGDSYVINARLGDETSGAVLWSRRFSRPANNVAGFQETTASHVSDVLRCGRSRARAYDGRMPDQLLALFLAACSTAREESDPARFVVATGRVVEAAPGLSTAHSMHAIATSRLAFMLAPPAKTAAILEQARTSARRARELDPRNAEALVALAASHADDWRLREDYLRRALQLDPDLSAANDFYIWFLMEVGRVREATAVAARAAAMDPFSANALERLAWLQAVHRAPAQSAASLERLKLVDPEVAVDVGFRIAFWHGEPRLAQAEIERLAARWLNRSDVACTAEFLEGGWLDGRRARLPAACSDLQAEWRVRMLARSGQIDLAYREVDAAFAELRNSTIFVFYPEMKAFRADPRFMPLAKRLGLVDYWLETDRWPDFCAEADLPYDCRAVAKALSSPKPGGGS